MSSTIKARSIHWWEMAAVFWPERFLQALDIVLFTLSSALQPPKDHWYRQVDRDEQKHMCTHVHTHTQKHTYTQGNWRLTLLGRLVRFDWQAMDVNIIRNPIIRWYGHQQHSLVCLLQVRLRGREKAGRARDRKGEKGREQDRVERGISREGVKVRGERASSSWLNATAV